MPTLLAQPTRIQAAETKPQLIDEYIGDVNSQSSDLSVARLRRPEGWTEPGQIPEFDEFTVVWRGRVRVQRANGELELKAGEAVIAHRGEWIQYSTPDAGGAEYIAIGLPDSPWRRYTGTGNAVVSCQW